MSKTQACGNVCGASGMAVGGAEGGSSSENYLFMQQGFVENACGLRPGSECFEGLQGEDLGSAAEYREDIVQILSEAYLLDGFGAQDIACLCQFMQCYGLPRHGRLFREGTTGDWLVFVLTGEVEVIKQDGEGAERVLGRVGPGEVLGEMSLVDGQRRFATCSAVRPSDVAVLSRSRMMELLAVNAGLANKLLWLLLQRLTARLRGTTLSLLPHLPIMGT